MAFNGSGTFLRLYNWVTDRTNSIKIRADRMDAEMDGLAGGLTNVICKDGQTTISANIPFNNKKITLLGDATAAADAMNRQSSDARYLQLIQNLTSISTLQDGDLFGLRDISGPIDAAISFLNLKTQLTTDFRADGRMFPVGTRMPFQQTTPPPGWTKETGAAYNDATVRFTTGTATNGGTSGFDTVFASRVFTGTVGNDTPTEGKTAPHDHIYGYANFTSNAVAGGGANIPVSFAQSGVTNALTSEAGGGGVHNHSLTMNAANFDVKFVGLTTGIKA